MVTTLSELWFNSVLCTCVLNKCHVFQDEKAKLSKTRLQAKSKIATLTAQLRESQQMSSSMTASVAEASEQVRFFLSDG